MLAALLAAPAAGQSLLAPDVDLDFDRPEAWALKYFASVALYTGMGVPAAAEPGSVEVGLEAGWVPRLDAEQRTVGFFGTKTEDVNRTEIFGRPRVAVGLPRRFTVSGSWLPPIEVFGVESHLLAVALARPIGSPGRWRVGARLALQSGRLSADFTCPGDAVAAGTDRDRNPFDCKEPSRDEATLDSASFEIAAAHAGRRLEPHVAIAVHALDLEFQVRARYSSVIDRTRYRTDGWTVTGAAGLTLPLARRSRVTLEALYAPLDVVRRRTAGRESDPLVNLRALASIRLR